MGTRSLTTVIESYKDKDEKVYNTKLLTMYRQMDGYPEGMGSDLAEFLLNGKLVDGIKVSGNEGLTFNGTGCLAAQLVAHFKKGCGGYYMVKPGSTGHGEQYRYEIVSDEENGTISLRAYEVGYMNSKNKYVNKSRKIFGGAPEELLTVFLKQREEKTV